MLGVNGRPRGTPPGPHGTLRNGKMAELRLESGIFGIAGSALCFLSSPPRLRRFRVFSIAALGVWRQWPIPRNGPRGPAKPHRTLRNGIMAELRIESFILGHMARSSSFLSSPTRLRWFRVFSIAALGVGRQWPTPRNISRDPTERYGSVKWRHYA